MTDLPDFVRLGDGRVVTCVDGGALRGIRCSDCTVRPAAGSTAGPTMTCSGRRESGTSRPIARAMGSRRGTEGERWPTRL